MSSKLFCPLDKAKEWAVVSRSFNDYIRISLAHLCPSTKNRYWATDEDGYWDCRPNKVTSTCRGCGLRSSKNIHSKAEFIMKSISNV